ncbi:hypothetical protein LPJ70_001742 [Coemansia sp. RSA 2708]|nr:hypothetical protein LPJ70_001742 [Coemansia sp. RSA 2708]
MLALQPSSQPALAPFATGSVHPLVVYLSSSIRRDVRLLAAMGAIGEQGARVIGSYLPHAADDADDADIDAAVLRALAPVRAASPAAKRLNRQRSETAPLRPAPAPLQAQRAPASPRREKPRHEGLGARLGAFFNKLALDSETSPRSSKASLASPRAHERSMSDAPQPASGLRAPHRVTVCTAPRTQQLRDEPRKASHGSQRSAASAASATLPDDSSAESSRSSVTLATRKRSFTHLGLSMESLPGARAAQPQLRRSKPSANIAQPRLAAPANSLGLVLQASLPKTRPVPAPIRTQRHHASFSAKEPRSPTRLGCLSAIVARSPKTPLAFPPMPSEACQAAMLSGATPPEPREPPPAPRALSDSAVDASLASLVVVATAAYDYASGVKGDLEFARGERIVIQSKVNDDWWFGSILPEAGRGSTGRAGMFPRSHVSLA